jgi:hypothetical protein
MTAPKPAPARPTHESLSQLREEQRASREQARALAKAALSPLQPGDAATIPLPPDPSRIHYATVSTVAKRLFGKGGYRVRTVAGGVQIIRLGAGYGK